MATEAETSVIHRKAKVARDEFDARAMSPAKALRLSLEKSADRLFGLALTVSTLEQRPVAHAAIQTEAGEGGLLMLLDGADGSRGALVLDVEFAAAVIEVQTMGRVRPAAAETRRLTQTDAAVAAPLIDALMEGFDARLAEALPHYPGCRYRFGDRVEDGRGLAIALEAPDYELFRITADIGEGAKTGVMTLLVPQALLHVPERTRPAAAPEDAAFGLEETAMSAPVLLDAVLARITLPLQRICALEPGMTLPLGSASPQNTRLLATRGHLVAKVRLGQLNGFRAVRFALPDADKAEADPAKPAPKRGKPEPVPKPVPAAGSEPPPPPREPPQEAGIEGGETPDDGWIVPTMAMPQIATVPGEAGKDGEQGDLAPTR